MFNNITIALYYLIICICLFLTLSKKKEFQFPLYLYFLLVIVTETLAYFLKEKSFIYQFGSLFYVAFFTFYYAFVTRRLRKLIYILGAVSFSVISFFVLKFDENFPTGIGISVSFLYIFLSIIWFFDEIRKPVNDFIIRKQAFWISAANLLWGIVFLFRVSLMYWLEEKDPAFLIVLDSIFKIVIILTYFSLLIAVTRKHQLSNV